MATLVEGRAYWVVAGTLILFGAVAIFSVGLPFLTVGIALVVLAPRRGQPRLFWPPLVGLISFFAGYILIAPLGCTATASSRDLTGSTSCSNLLGLNYLGSTPYEPPLWPAVVAGVIAAAVGWGAAHFLARRRRASVG